METARAQRLRSMYMAKNFEAPHAIDWNSIKVLDRATSQTERRVREALHICKRKPAMNRDQGVEVSNAWKTTV